MTREQLNKHWAVIEAYRNGAEVEYFQFGKWLPIEIPAFLVDTEYRIKKQPELIPFDFSDAEKLIGKAVKRKTNGHCGVITFVEDSEIEIGGICISYNDLYKWFTFLDGTPCGKQKQ